MKLTDAILQLLFPEKCVLCRKVLKKDELDLCHSCRTDVPEFRASRKKLPFLDSWVAVWYYEKKARKSLLRYKFGRKRSYAQSYGRLLAMRLLEAHPDGFDLLTWVPTGWLKRLTRGFDQCQLLALAVGKELGMEPQQLIRKIRSNKTQSTIRGEAKRRANVLGVYKVTEPELVKDKRVLLLDDIITTGATAGECARILLTSGASQVHCGAVAAARHQAKSSR
jgi:ComF family protein